MRIGLNLFDFLSRLHTSAFTPNRSPSATSTQDETATANAAIDQQPVVLADSLARLLAESTPTDPTAVTETPEVVGSTTNIEPTDPLAPSDAPTTGNGETTPVVDTTETEPPAPHSTTDEKVRGVIRLLQDGHFKGVADVRLRLNNFDELSAESLSAVTPPKSNGKAYDKFLAEYNAKFAPVAPEVNEVV